jgi:hypothetical protein
MTLDELIKRDRQSNKRGGPNKRGGSFRGGRGGQGRGGFQVREKPRSRGGIFKRKFVNDRPPRR